jgi:hypothetical protein
VSCIALQDGALLANVSRAQFISLVVERPHVLKLYLQQGTASLYRVAQFVLNDFLQVVAFSTSLGRSALNYKSGLQNLLNFWPVASLCRYHFLLLNPPFSLNSTL